MRIVIDMQGAQTESRFRGIGRYTISFVQAVIRARGEHDVVLALNGLFTDTIEPIRALFDPLLEQKNIRVWYAPGPTREIDPEADAKREVAELVREAFISSLAPDLVHLTSLFEGFLDDAVTSIGRFDQNTPVSVSLYDLIPLLNPAEYLTPNPRFQQHYLRKIEHLKRAAACLAISEFAKHEGVAQINAPNSSFVNVSTAVEPRFRPIDIDATQADKLRNKFGIIQPFILYTGGDDRRKNLPRLIEAFAALPSRLRLEHNLVLAGKVSGEAADELEQIARAAGLHQDKLLFTGYVNDDELVGLYNLCRLYVFPSWHEGFGLPALEAMACGAIVIGANTSSLPEVIGFDDALFDPFDVASMSAKIAQGLENKAFRTSLREHGLQRASQFSWQASAKQAWSAWEAQVDARSSAPAELLPADAEKPTLAFVSPFPPERTGIADFSAELLPALAHYYDITIVVAQDRVDDLWANEHSKIQNVDWLRAHAGEIDRILYHIGNSTFHQHMLPLLEEIPGTVVLHDFFLSNLMEWLEGTKTVPRAWTQSLYEAHGWRTVRERFKDPQSAVRDYPASLSVLQHACGAIVHSRHALGLVEHWYGHEFSKLVEVVPLLRAEIPSIDRRAARAQLGIDESDFVVCSFGLMGPNKLNHRLLNSWLASSLAKRADCRLVFVGKKNLDDYGQRLIRAIASKKGESPIQITDYAPPTVFRQYLMAADVAVQIRTDSRGETSAAVLDCMNYALPVIVNANGAMNELDPAAVWMLPDVFEDNALTQALETLAHDPKRRYKLGVYARNVIVQQHLPKICAARYAAAIERFYESQRVSAQTLVQAIAAQLARPTNAANLFELSRAIDLNMPLRRATRRLLLDVTATRQDDLKTGIQRVARALTLALLNVPPYNFRVEPVYLNFAGGIWRHCHARRYTLGLLNCPDHLLDDEPIEPNDGDVLVVLDIAGESLWLAEEAGLFSSYRNRGVKVHSVVFDLLPVRMPEVFPPGADWGHKRWLAAISNFDGALCISNAVAADLAAWHNETALHDGRRRAFQIAVLPLGADMDSSFPTRGIPPDAKATLQQLVARPTFLMVGTIEPRKGYIQTIEAFRQLWVAGVNVNLVVVGKEGWIGLPNESRRDIPQTVQQLKTMPESGKRLFWLEGVSDEYLLQIYAVSTCLIAASLDEGFGLPLIEAAQHKLPIIARDILVFREVAGEHVFYFTGHQPCDMVNAINAWLELFEANNHPKSAGMPWVTWQESAVQLANNTLDS